MLSILDDDSCILIAQFAGLVEGSVAFESRRRVRDVLGPCLNSDVLQYKAEHGMPFIVPAHDLHLEDVLLGAARGNQLYTFDWAISEGALGIDDVAYHAAERGHIDILARIDAVAKERKDAARARRAAKMALAGAVAGGEIGAAARALTLFNGIEAGLDLCNDVCYAIFHASRANDTEIIELMVAHVGAHMPYLLRQRRHFREVFEFRGAASAGDFKRAVDLYNDAAESVEAYDVRYIVEGGNVELYKWWCNTRNLQSNDWMTSPVANPRHYKDMLETMLSAAVTYQRKDMFEMLIKHEGAAQYKNTALLGCAREKDMIESVMEWLGEDDKFCRAMGAAAGKRWGVLIKLCEEGAVNVHLGLVIAYRIKCATTMFLMRERGGILDSSARRYADSTPNIWRSYPITSTGRDLGQLTKLRMLVKLWQEQDEESAYESAVADARDMCGPDSAI